MASRSVSVVSGVVFAIIALLHLLRLIFSWPAQIAGWQVPAWLSVVGVIVAVALAWGNLKSPAA